MLKKVKCVEKYKIVHPTRKIVKAYIIWEVNIKVLKLICKSFGIVKVLLSFMDIIFKCISTMQCLYIRVYIQCVSKMLK